MAQVPVGAVVAAAQCAIRGHPNRASLSVRQGLDTSLAEEDGQMQLALVEAPPMSWPPGL